MSKTPGSSEGECSKLILILADDCACSQTYWLPPLPFPRPPAPHALDLFPVSIEYGQVKVDTGEVIQRQFFETSQVALP